MWRYASRSVGAEHSKEKGAATFGVLVGLAPRSWPPSTTPRFASSLLPHPRRCTLLQETSPSPKLRRFLRRNVSTGGNRRAGRCPSPWNSHPRAPVPAKRQRHHRSRCRMNAASVPRRGPPRGENRGVLRRRDSPPRTSCTSAGWTSRPDIVRRCRLRARDRPPAKTS